MQEADSTNTFLKGMKNCDDDTIVVAVADYQTAGRGQGAHTWESEPGKNLLSCRLVQLGCSKAVNEILGKMEKPVHLIINLTERIKDSKIQNMILYGILIPL